MRQCDSVVPFGSVLIIVHGSLEGDDLPPDCQSKFPELRRFEMKLNHDAKYFLAEYNSSFALENE
jgi:hypothetical protein